MEDAAMLTKDRLSEAQWATVRNTPHHVVVAVSAIGGSPLDEMFERSAGLKGIVEAMNSTHPLLREIADSINIMNAQDAIQSWYYTLDEADRSPAVLQEKAIESMRQALDALIEHGGPEDLLHYSEFVQSLAMRVARAAREGDVMGLGGELVSRNEERFIERLRALTPGQKA
jgi:hypothetical protein